MAATFHVLAETSAGRVYLPGGCMAAGLSAAAAATLIEDVAKNGCTHPETGARIPAGQVLSLTTKAWRDYAKAHSDCKTQADADRAAKGGE